MKISYSPIVLVVGLPFLSGCAGSDNRSTTDDPPERIVYTTFRPGNWDIFYFAQPGGPPERLTDDPGLDYDPVFSPDGRWVVFCSERRGNPDLYFLDLDKGGVPRRLIDSDGMEDQATISPDGETIAFVSTRDGNADIFTLPFRPNQTLSIEPAVNLTNHRGGDFRPAFSPDGTKIAFSTDRDSPPSNDSPIIRRRDGEIYIMNRDGSNLQQLTHNRGWDGSPAWSSDGETIYFYSERDADPTTFPPFTRMWAMDSDGANHRLITPLGLHTISPAPTGSGRVAFAELVPVVVEG